MTDEQYIGLRSATVDAYGTAGTLPRIARAIPTDEQAQIQRLRESAQRAQDALTEKCGEVAELQQKLADAELRIRTANDRAIDAAQTAERALTRLVEQEPLVKTAQAWLEMHPSARDKLLIPVIRHYNEIESKRS